MADITIKINGLEVTVPAGSTILDAAKKLNIKIPKRQFIGDSRELTTAIGAKIQTELASVLSS